jgi:PucR C-terminal helix-turn-helix domain/GGDEF-like domain
MATASPAAEGGAHAPAPSAARACARLTGRLRERSGEIEQTILERIHADEGPTEAPDPEYGEGLRAAVPAAIGYCLEGIERSEASPPQIPTALLSQARVAARNGVALDTVLCRYFAGYTLLGDFLLQEAEIEGLRCGAELKRILRSLAATFDRLLAAVGEEHSRETERPPRTSERRRAELIERLIAGEPLDATELAYDFSGHHLGLIAKGEGGSEAIRALARALDRRLLLLEREEDTAWAWLGGRKPINSSQLEAHLRTECPAPTCLSVGEPSKGPAGWRLTHRQAAAALPIALRGESLVRYADVALLASIAKDELLSTSLHQMYLAPLDGERGGGEIARETLRAYFASGYSVSSAAAVLGVNRNTVTNRFRSVEELIGRSLDACATEVAMALHLENLGVSKS